MRRRLGLGRLAAGSLLGGLFVLLRRQQRAVLPPRGLDAFEAAPCFLDDARSRPELEVER